MRKVVYIEVSIGELPEWYDENEHDLYLEDMIERYWHSNPDYENAEVRVVYNYTGEYATVRGWDYEGELVFERNNHDTEFAFEYARLMTSD